MGETIVRGSVFAQICPSTGLPSSSASKKFQTGVNFSPSGFSWKPTLLKSPIMTPSTRIDAAGSEHSESVSTLVREDRLAVRPGKMLRWWEKSLQSNVKEIISAQHLVDSLRLCLEELRH